MTTQVATQPTSPEKRNWLYRFLDSLPGSKWLKSISIGKRLLLGFGIMVLITLIGAGLSYYGSSAATQNIDLTGDVRVPTALASSQAQANLLRMLGDVRGYLALGQPEYIESYNQARDDFDKDLQDLKDKAANLNTENQRRLNELEAAFKAWSALPEQLFELRDDQLEREPAYKVLATDGILQGGRVLIGINQMIERQGQREATTENIAVLANMAQFQGTFASMLSGLRGYVTTRNRLFKGEYEANLAINAFAWERLLDRRNTLTLEQQATLDEIAQYREAFLQLPDGLFEILEGDRWREDLYLFSTEAIPLTEKMQQLLAEMTLDQQNLLQQDLNRGRAGLARANLQTLIGGLVALALGVALAFIFRENIAGPIRRLTGVADQIRQGDLEAQAEVEAGDEIGTLAATFNNMTGQLRGTLQQVQKEKKRADDLLEVVIPIGIELSAEKDFNRLLENILLEAKSFCKANAGILYLRRDEEENLRLTIIRNDRHNIALGGTTNLVIPYPPVPLQLKDGSPNESNVVSHAALSGLSVNITDASNSSDSDYNVNDYQDTRGELKYQAATSILTIPLKNPQNQVLGVLQLLDAEDPDTRQVIAFDQNLQQMMESFSSLASAALEAYIREQSLKKEIQQLRIEIDETKRQQQVSEIVDTDFFSDLQARAQDIRSRHRRTRRKDGDDETSEAAE